MLPWLAKPQAEATTWIRPAYARVSGIPGFIKKKSKKAAIAQAKNITAMAVRIQWGR